MHLCVFEYPEYTELLEKIDIYNYIVPKIKYQNIRQNKSCKLTIYVVSTGDCYYSFEMDDDTCIPSKIGWYGKCLYKIIIPQQDGKAFYLGVISSSTYTWYRAIEFSVSVTFNIYGNIFVNKAYDKIMLAKMKKLYEHATGTSLSSGLHSILESDSFVDICFKFK